MSRASSDAIDRAGAHTYTPRALRLGRGDARLAQLDRVLASEAKGRRFESGVARRIRTSVLQRQTASGRWRC